MRVGVKAEATRLLAAAEVITHVGARSHVPLDQLARDHGIIG